MCQSDIWQMENECFPTLSDDFYVIYAENIYLSYSQGMVYSRYFEDKAY